MTFQIGHTINVGRKCSEETKIKISTAHKGSKKPWSTGQSARGRIQSFEERQMRSKSMKGKNRGHKSEQTKLKMSISHRGKVPWNKGKTGFSWGIKGDKNHNWKGGVTSVYKQIRKSSQYKQWRTNIFERDDYICQLCLIRGGKLHADHIKPFADYPKLRFELSNGRTLCEKCHRKTDTWGWNILHKHKAENVRRLYFEKLRT